MLQVHPQVLEIFSQKRNGQLRLRGFGHAQTALKEDACSVTVRHHFWTVHIFASCGATVTMVDHSAVAAQIQLPEAKLLPDGPTDAISALQYLSQSSSSSSSFLLASTSWDGTVRIHDTAQSQLVLAHAMESGPLLSLTTAIDDETVVMGGMDGSIRRLNVQSKTTTAPEIIGRHEAAVSSLSSSNGNACRCLGSLSADDSSSGSPVIVSAGWDQRFHVWDIRQSSSSSSSHHPKPAATVALPGKAFAMDVDPTHARVVIGTSDRRIVLVDVRKGTTAPFEANVILDRESSLKFQTRAVRFFPDGDGLAIGSIEARVAIEYLEELGLPPKGKKYAFKCHRVGDRVFPVNCIEFHRKYGTFATGGCDGTVMLWDGLHKKKLTTLPQFPTSIAAMAFHPNGSELAIASSYTFEEGEREHPHDEIYVRDILDSECMPKSK